MAKMEMDFAGRGITPASRVSFENAGTDLSSDNVQDAVVELNNSLVSKLDKIYEPVKLTVANGLSIIFNRKGNICSMATSGYGSIDFPADDGWSVLTDIPHDFIPESDFSAIGIDVRTKSLAWMAAWNDDNPTYPAKLGINSNTYGSGSKTLGTRCTISYLAKY